MLPASASILLVSNTALADAAAADAAARAAGGGGTRLSGVTVRPDTSKLQDGIAPNCNRFYMVQPNDYCIAIAEAAGIPPQKFLDWNRGVGPWCTSLWAGYYACVGVSGEPPPPEPAAPPAGVKTPTAPVAPSDSVETPTPTQDGMVDNCREFHLVKTGESCAEIATDNSVSVVDLIRWNAGIGVCGTNMRPQHWLCVDAKA